jgi:hypothetical protein
MPAAISPSAAIRSFRRTCRSSALISVRSWKMKMYPRARCSRSLRIETAMPRKRSRPSGVRNGFSKRKRRSRSRILLTLSMKAGDIPKTSAAARPTMSARRVPRISPAPGLTNVTRAPRSVVTSRS